MRTASNSPLEPADAQTHEPAVRLYLRLARPACADAASQTFQVTPLTGQPRQKVLGLRQLHLQTPLVRSSVTREYVKDERRTVDDLDLFLERTLQVPLLRRRQLVIADDGVELDGLTEELHLLQLPFPKVRNRLRFDLLGNGAYDFRARCPRELREFAQRIGARP